MAYQMARLVWPGPKLPMYHGRIINRDEVSTMSITRIHAGSDRQDQTAIHLEKLENLLALKDGWNRHGAAAPSLIAIGNARDVIELLVKDEQPPTRIASSAVGGVGVTRQVGDRLVYLEIYNEGKACALFADNSGDERVVELETPNYTLKVLLEGMKAYLHACPRPDRK
jgi:hypothetical protein